MKIKTSELIGAQLDWAVAKALDFKPVLHDDECGADFWICQVPWGGYADVGVGFNPSGKWNQCIDMFTRHGVSICVVIAGGIGFWRGECGSSTQSGHEMPIAGCRALVAAKLGEEIEVPEELV